MFFNIRAQLQQPPPYTQNHEGVGMVQLANSFEDNVLNTDKFGMYLLLAIERALKN